MTLPVEIDQPAQGRAACPAPPSAASVRSRLMVLALIVISIAMLAIARVLVPDPMGYGTHQQLGLPPCASILLTGSRCPACGMTTAWSFVVRGRLGDAWQANAGGTWLAITAASYIPLSVYFLIRGSWSHRGWFSLSLALSLSVGLLLSVTHWLFS